MNAYVFSDQQLFHLQIGYCSCTIVSMHTSSLPDPKIKIYLFILIEYGVTNRFVEESRSIYRCFNKKLAIRWSYIRSEILILQCIIKNLSKRRFTKIK